MNKEAKTYQLINDYLNGSLSNTDKAVVELRLQEDEGFKSYLETHKKANEIIILNEELAIKNKLSLIHEKSVVRKKRFKLFLLVLLTICIVVIALFTFKGEDPIKVSLVQESKVEKSNEFVMPNITSKIEVVEAESISKEPLKPKEEIYELNSIEELLDTINTDTLILPLDSTLIEKEIIFDISPSKVEIELPKVNEDSPKHVCEEYEANIALESFSTCKNKSNGMVKVTTNETYKYSLNGNKTKQDEPMFSGLTEGNHTIVTFDEYNCESEAVLFQIEGVQCDFVLQPSQGIYWQIKTNYFDSERVNLEIFNARSGQKVFENVLNLFEKNSWSGVNSSGNSLPMGSYVYVLKSKSKMRTGNITIVQ